MRKFLSLLTILLCHPLIHAENIPPNIQIDIQTVKTQKLPSIQQFDRQKKALHAELEHLHQLFDGKSTFSYDIRYFDTGEKIIEKNNYLRLNPGSLVSLATAVSALELLGREFSFQSTVWTQNSITPASIKKGVYAETLYVDLYLDPYLSYKKMLQLAEQIKRKGITTLESRLIFARHHTMALAEGWELKQNHPLVVYMNGQIQIDTSYVKREEAFLKALKEKGINIKDTTITYFDEEETTSMATLASVESPTLISLLQRGWQEKDPVLFEALLRAMGEAKQKSNKSLRLGILQMRDFLSLRALLNCDEMALFDGSGTSNLSLLSVKQFTNLFLFARNQFHLDADLLAALPTLKNTKKKGPPYFARAILSTEGSTASVTGIIETKQKNRVVFCCIVNNARPLQADLEKGKEKAESFLQTFCQTLYDEL